MALRTGLTARVTGAMRKCHCHVLCHLRDKLLVLRGLGFELLTMTHFITEGSLDSRLLQQYVRVELYQVSLGTFGVCEAIPVDIRDYHENKGDHEAAEKMLAGSQDGHRHDRQFAARGLEKAVAGTVVVEHA